MGRPVFCGSKFPTALCIHEKAMGAVDKQCTLVKDETVGAVDCVPRVGMADDALVRTGQGCRGSGTMVSCIYRRGGATSPPS